MTKQSDIRIYTYRDKHYPSVTSILKFGLPKPALINWAAKVTAETAMDNLDKLADMPFAKGVTMLSKAHERVRNTRASEGTSIHNRAEAYAKGTPLRPVSAKVAPYIEQFDLFVRDFRPTFLSSEVTVYSDKYGYAGTQDSRILIDGREYALDYKTGKRVYPDVALQLVAYDRADYAVVDGVETPIVPAKRGLVLNLHPDGYQLVPVRLDDEVFDAFLAVYDVFTWLTDTSHRVIGQPKEPRDRTDNQPSGETPVV